MPHYLCEVAARVLAPVGRTNTAEVLRLLPLNHHDENWSMTTVSHSPPSNPGGAVQKRTTIRVVVIDDHPAIREALAHTIGGKSDLTFVGEAESATEAIDLIGTVNPDVAVVDISLKEGHGLDLVEEIRSRFADVRVIVFSMYDESAYAERAIRAGALGYVMKTAPTQHVIDAIREASTGRIYLSRNMAARILTKMVKGRLRPGLKFAVDELTDRELAVFQLLGEGVGVDEIADRLVLSRKTVEAYRRRAKEKLGLESVAELLQHAVHWASGRKSN